MHLVTVFSFLFLFILMWLSMWAFFKFMYPKPPREFMPKRGDIITPRDCDYCGYPLAEYRGVLEEKPIDELSEEELEEIDRLQNELANLKGHATDAKSLNVDATNKTSTKPKMTRQQRKAYNEQQKQIYNLNQDIKKLNTWFFCNYEHQASFHGKEVDSEQVPKP